MCLLWLVGQGPVLVIGQTAFYPAHIQVCTYQSPPPCCMRQPLTHTVSLSLSLARPLIPYVSNFYFLFLKPLGH